MNAAVIQPTCPHLGMRPDPDAFYSYPSTGNLCYHCRRPGSPSLGHQEAYCLTGAHEDCPVYLQPATKAFPATLRAQEQRRSILPAAIAAVLAIAIALAALGFGGVHYFPSIISGGWRMLQALPVVTVPSVTVAAAPRLTPTAAASAVPTSTPEPSATTPKPAGTHALEVPIDVDGHELLLHRVGSGETFETVTAKYQTTAQAIRALNYSIGASLFESSVIVIEPGQQTIDTALPSFLTHRVGDAPASSIDQVAAQFNVSPNLMRRYNGCIDGCELVASDWVLIPVLPQ